MKSSGENLWFRPRFLALLLTLATLGLYLPVTRHDFVNFDDDDYVTANHMVQGGLTPAGIRWAFTTFHASNWHPVTWLSHMLDCQLFGLNPAAHHFVNALIHSLNAGLLFILLLRLTGAVGPAWLVAALFAWHPLHVESVAWIAERKDVLSTFFALLTLMAYIRFATNRDPAASAAGHGRLWLWPALVCFALGLMAKPMLVTLPFVMLLLDCWPLQRLPVPAAARPSGAMLTRLFFQLLLEKWLFFLLAAGCCVVTVFAQRAEAVRTFTEVPLPFRLENAVVATATYLAQLGWPADLAVLYPLPSAIPGSAVLISGALLVLISVLVLRLARTTPCLVVGWLWFLGTLVPVIGLVQVGAAAHADRYTYFPSIGIFLGVVFGWQTFRPPRGSPLLSGVAGLAVLAACALATEHQLGFWRDSETLFRRALAVTRDNATAHLNLGSALQAEDRPADAIAEYQAALRLDPGLFEADSNLGKLLYQTGRLEEALGYCELAVRLKPGRAELHSNLGLTLSALGRYDEALAQFAEAARRDATYATPHFQTGRTLLKLGRDSEAVPYLFAALQREPDNLQFLLYTARVLATDTEARIRDGTNALALARQVVQESHPAPPAALDTLALALAELGRFDEAASAGAQACDLAGKSQDLEDLATLRRHLDQYLKHQPWRESFRATNAPPGN